MQKRHWRDIGFFAGGTFLGGWVLGILGRVYRKVGG